MPQAPQHIDYFEGPVSALVIGIGKYGHGVTLEKEKAIELADEEFPNLRYAAKDAQRFAGFLSAKGVTNVHLLVDEDATLPGIKGGFRKLRLYCKEVKDYYDSSGGERKEPLIIVFFSGHGWADSENKHYLIPHEAKRNELEETAFSNKDFKDRLQELDTDKLVVFLDACHAGAMARENSKGNLLAYDFKKDLDDLGEGEGRYVISSCKPDQKSWESEKFESGVFTHHLLQLLACEEKEVIDQLPHEEIDILTLFNVLESQVKQTSWAAYQEKQEPQINTDGGSKFIIAINHQRRKERLSKEDQDQKNRSEFQQKVCDTIDSDFATCEFRTTIKYVLKVHVEKPVEDKKELKDFYSCFREHYALWIEEGKSTDPLKDCCKILIYYYDEYRKVRRATVTDLRTPGTEKPSEGVAGTASVPIVTGEAVKTSTGSEMSDAIISTEKTTSPATPLHAVADDSKINLSSQVVTILQPLRGGNYANETMQLFQCLGQPVSEAEFESCVQQIKNKNADAGLHQALGGVTKNFKDQWQQTKKPAASFSTVASLRNF